MAFLPLCQRNVIYAAVQAGDDAVYSVFPPSFPAPLNGGGALLLLYDAHNIIRNKTLKRGGLRACVYYYLLEYGVIPGTSGARAKALEASS